MQAHPQHEQAQSEPHATDVIFRIFPQGDVIALFPADAGTRDWRCTCNSYQHIGQHGAASTGLSRATRPATQAQYAALQRELEQIGYTLRIVSRFTRKHMRSRMEQAERTRK